MARNLRRQCPSFWLGNTPAGPPKQRKGNNMILIEDRTHTTYANDTVEVWTYNMKLRFKLDKCRVKRYPECYEVISLDGQHVATFPAGETAFMMKTPETTVQITQTKEE